MTSQPFREEEASDEYSREISDLAAEALSRLGLRGDSTAEQIVLSIYERAEKLRPLDGDELMEETITLASLWGQQVCAALGWTWVILKFGSEETAVVVPADRRYAIWPIEYFRDILESTERDNTVLLLFNMLSHDKVPDAKPMEYQLLS